MIIFIWIVFVVVFVLAKMMDSADNPQKMNGMIWIGMGALCLVLDGISQGLGTIIFFVFLVAKFFLWTITK